MKRMLLLFIAAGFALSCVAQFQPHFTNAKSDVKAINPTIRIDGNAIGSQEPNSVAGTKSILEDPVVIQTKYDLQTNASQQHRLYLFDDGTMGAVVTMSHQDNFSERGTGYNYFDGTTWGAQPAARIETVRTGWPAYAPLGPNGEIVVAHQSGTTPLIISRRDTKGTGAWTQTELGPPAGASGMLWCRMVTNGTDRMNVHVISLTAPTGNGGVVWNSLNGALVYNRSLDGGNTWDGWLLLDGMTSSDYLGFGGDAYVWAEPDGDNLAFLVGDSWNDQFIMKSTDNGDNWTKTTIWSCPYNLWAGGDTTGTFWCPDGNNAAAIGPDGTVHILFGLQRAMGDEAGAKYWYPYTDGLIYWNETMPELPQGLDPDELFALGNYIGWVQDTMVFYEGSLAYYYNSMSSIPTLVVDEDNYVFAIWSGVTTLVDADGFLLRHVLGRGSTDGGETWEDYFYDLTGNFLYTWSECVFATASATSTDKLYVLFQADDLAGNYLKGSQGAAGQAIITDNLMTVLSPFKTDILYPVGVNEVSKSSFEVSSIFPNPVHGLSTINVIVDKPGTLSLQVFNLLGQQVYEWQKGFVNRGTHQFFIDGNQFHAGVYFYTVTFDKEKISKKMIVE
ncbi:MAG: T9SS type A sorting domain-containing protein [Bacteroidota bacterium]